MYRLKIGLDYSVFRVFFAKDSAYNRNDLLFQHRLVQHQIVLSDGILDYYSEKAVEKGEESLVDVYLNDQLIYANTPFEYIGQEPKETIEEEFKELLPSKMGNRLFIYEEDELKLNKIKRTRPVKRTELDDDKFNPLNLYSFPIAHFYVLKGENREIYLRWLGHLFEGEKVIRIIDPYIYSKLNFSRLNELILPLIEEGTSVEIYGKFNRGECSLDYLKDQLKNEKKRLSLYALDRSSVHDRHFWAGDLDISIGVGLDFIRTNETTVKRNTEININYGTFEEPALESKSPILLL